MVKYMRFRIGIIFVILAISGCAKKPESIAPAYVSPVNYQSLNCNQLAQEQSRLNDAYTSVSQQQKDARTGDTVGVLLLGVPASSLSGGNVAAQVAQVKGEQKTVQQVMIQKNCN